MGYCRGSFWSPFCAKLGPLEIVKQWEWCPTWQKPVWRVLEYTSNRCGSQHSARGREGSLQHFYVRIEFTDLNTNSTNSVIKVPTLNCFCKSGSLLVMQDEICVFLHFDHRSSFSLVVSCVFTCVRVEHKHAVTDLKFDHRQFFSYQEQWVTCRINISFVN